MAVPWHGSAEDKIPGYLGILVRSKETIQTKDVMPHLSVQTVRLFLEHRRNFQQMPFLLPPANDTSLSGYQIQVTHIRLHLFNYGVIDTCNK